MREIKYKAYVKWFNKNEMIDLLGFAYEGETSVRIWWKENGITKNISLAKEDLYLLEYTGLKDKNGREIYEGDIVQLSETNPVLFKVEVILARFGYKTVFKYMNDEVSGSGYFLDRCEVIGTIYDNPELLKESE